MKSYINKIRSPVKREGAAKYLRITLVSFAISVIFTRIFLQATGFPQLGGPNGHIAHVLFGGLMLFVSSLLPLIFSNRSVLVISSIISGVGVGLFIDEVGKFLTVNNDYFYPPAMPIIYAFFLLVVLIYIQVKRIILPDPRTELYRALDSLQEVLDYDLDNQELARLRDRLQKVSDQDYYPALSDLAKSLNAYLKAEAQVVPQHKGFIEKSIVKLAEIEERIFTRRILKIILIVGFSVFGIVSFFDLVTAFLAFLSPDYLFRLVSTLVSQGRIISDAAVSWFLVRLVLQGIVGLLLLLAAVFLARGFERRAVNFGYFGILVSLTTVNLLVFYFDQFKAIYGTIAQILLLLVVVTYRRRFFYS
ncbi:hypothetical protein A2115_03590 [Candidatus Woesebacteria bacterium GWA1_41_8]|uniref:Uncharacterized protein n=1 Tax=Candidatus Woesebacteria bacterium GWA1_41_8 TaxID=1802471 RepID=A0A1F7WG60_9BACT|nr:MAG: hypothetical protein A2115_03590 [Candidatus Woesebacteria bacterium GWA1_41_8]